MIYREENANFGSRDGIPTAITTNVQEEAKREEESDISNNSNLANGNIEVAEVARRGEAATTGSTGTNTHNPCTIM